MTLYQKVVEGKTEENGLILLSDSNTKDTGEYMEKESYELNFTNANNRYYLSYCKCVHCTFQSNCLIIPFFRYMAILCRDTIMFLFFYKNHNIAILQTNLFSPNFLSNLHNLNKIEVLYFSFSKFSAKS